MSTLRISTVVLLVVCVLSINVALILPAFHDSKAGRDLLHAAFDAPTERAAELRTRARAVIRAEQLWIFGVGAMMAAVSGALLGWRIYRCGGVSAALWQVSPQLPPMP
jgi:metallophosphoesterase superfamily enzyme